MFQQRLHAESLVSVQSLAQPRLQCRGATFGNLVVTGEGDNSLLEQDLSERKT
jgi:hypothetical protein